MDSSVLGKLERVWDTPQRWRFIREFYSYATPLILAGVRVDPYPLGCKFTPIEQRLWEEIRYYGLPFYPQYPIGRVFVDFADPVLRIVLEADGKQFHDAEKDDERDMALRGQGWAVIRFKGRDILRSENILERVFAYYERSRDGSTTGDDDEC